MRTPEEILNEVRRQQSGDGADLFGTRVADMVECLSFDLAREFLKPEVTAADWEVVAADDEAVKARMLKYMDFAWDKANNNRGLSAMRSMAHMGAWLWLLGEDAAAQQMVAYTHYGKPQLRAICEHFGWDWRKWDDGRWTSDEMDAGESADAVPVMTLNWKP